MLLVMPAKTGMCIIRAEMPIFSKQLWKTGFGDGMSLNRVRHNARLQLF
jgi:hypothetical protein